MSNAATNVSEHDVIAKVVQRYIDGAKSGRGDDMKPAFHKDATIFGYVGADLFAGPIQQLFDYHDVSRIAEYATVHSVVQRGDSLLPGAGNRDALPRREAVHLDHDAAVPVLDEPVGLTVRIEYQTISAWNAVALHELS